MVEFVNQTDFPLPFTETDLSSWLMNVVTHEHKTLGDLTIILGRDDWLLEYNKTYLQHDYYTDIITFDYTEENLVSGDLLISIDRVIDNANTLNVPRETELMRVIVHGLLHLLGYKDKSDEDILLMRSKEDYYLGLLV